MAKNEGKIKKTSWKKWTYNEVCYLKEHWGETNMKKIAQNLHRSLNSIKMKAQKLGLKDWLKYHEFISLNQFHKMINGGPLDSYDLMIWEREGMPIKKIKKINRTYLMIDFEDFIKWYKTHLSILDISRTQDGDFGVEPEWLKEKRKADKMAQEYKARPWTPTEDSRLKAILKTYRYGYREISVMLKRTEGAIKRRMNDLQIMERPLRADNHNPWTEKEIETVRKMHLKGYKSVVIAEFINRSALAINGLIERHKYFGMPPLKGGKPITRNGEQKCQLTN